MRCCFLSHERPTSAPHRLRISKHVENLDHFESVKRRGILTIVEFLLSCRILSTCLFANSPKVFFPPQIYSSSRTVERLILSIVPRRHLSLVPYTEANLIFSECTAVTRAGNDREGTDSVTLGDWAGEAKTSIRFFLGQ